MTSRPQALLRRWWGVALLAALAYVPSLSAGHGRMPADTKLYLYLDPGRLVGDAPWTFDPRQFAGWVPHQTISYLWPSGPWFWTFERLGFPDWLAHRLWIGTILFVAALGVRWMCGLLAVTGAAAVAAAAVYELTPFVLPYLSRTSLMLLPYASVGWVVGLTVLAATRTRWRHAALLALVVATVGAPNATAIAMIAPAPVLWLVHAAIGGEITWRRALATAGRIAALCVPVSLWWLAMLAVQGRYGADVLAYSETLEAVSLTTLSTETLRGMGYWLFYVRDPVGFTTSAAEAYMSSGRLIVTSFLLTGIGLLGLALVRFRARRFAVLLVLVGTVLAVGVHPIDDPSPLMSPFAGSSRSTLVLALRSSTRALPLSVLGLALGTGALVAAVTPRLRRARWVPATAVVALAAVNLPAAWNGGFVDDVISRDEDPPAAWLDAAAALDELPAGYRVLQVPGQEFGAYTWGYTVDPPLPGLTDRPLVTRDLLPLGSPAAMDLLYALDDRFQDGVAELDAVAPVARLVGADTVWLPNDVWFDRFRTPRPEPVAARVAQGATGLGDPVPYGEPFVPAPVLEDVDETALTDPAVGDELEPVWLVPVDDPVPVVRAKSSVVAVAGSGEGVVDAAAAGVLDGDELVVYTSALPDAASPSRVVVTDSNRDQARQWRGSQDTRGFTEDGGAGSGVLREDTADQRLVWGEAGADHHTVAIQEGPVTAAASAYGEPFAYRPEDRAAMAVDGDVSTAWRVADRADARGEVLELTTTEPVDAVTLLQPATGSTGLAPNRWITAVDVVVDGGAPLRVELDDTSRSAPGQRVDLPAAGTTIRITIAATADAPVDPIAPARRDAVGFAEVDAGLGATTEIVRPPVDWLDLTRDGTPATVVVSRWRVAATDRWRRDPEPALVRDVTVTGGTAEVTVRLDPRAADATIAGAIGWTGTVATDRATGAPRAGGWAATDGDVDTAWRSPFGAPTGATLTIPVTAGTTSVEQLELRQPTTDASPITEVVLEGSAGPVTVVVPPADADGVSVLTVPPVPVDGTLRLTVSQVEPRTTRDRRSAELVVLPSAITELSSPAWAPAPLPAAVDLGCRDDLLTVAERPVGLDLGTIATSALVAGEPVVATAVESCADPAPIDLAAGLHRLSSRTAVGTGWQVDRVVVGRTPPPSTDLVRTTVVDRDRTSRRIEVAACPDGCWLVLGEGHNDGWAATLDGDDLGPPSIVDGGFNGWWLPPSASAREVTVRWTPQRTVSVALAASAIAVAGCLALAVWDRRRAPARTVPAPRLTGWRADPRVHAWMPAVVTGVTAFLTIGPAWGVAGALAGGVAGALRRPRLLALAGFALWGVVRADRAVARPPVRTVPERRVAGHVRGPPPAGAVRRGPARRFAGGPGRPAPATRRAGRHR